MKHSEPNISGGRFSIAQEYIEEDVDGVRFRTSDEREGGAEHHPWSSRHRALAQRGSEGRQEFRPAMPRRILR